MLSMKYNSNSFCFFPVDKTLDHIVEDFHAERGDNGDIVFVSDGKRDIQKEINSQKCNAGLQNILRLQTMRYGTLDNAIARNKEKQVFADVSKIPDSVGEQAEMVATARSDIQALANKYGVTVDQLLALKSEKEFVDLITPKQTEGGNSNV